MKDKLKEISDKYYQECKVILLPTQSKSNISIDAYGRMYFGNYPENTPFNQHVYITSNEEIKEGDWFINRQYMIEEDREEYAIWRCGGVTPNSNPKKIIATTDTNLLKDYSEQTLNDFACLPQPSKAFIQAYIKAYNESKPITKVLVEMESAFNVPTIYDYKQIKINSSNEITIKKVKDSYTREEVKQLLRKFSNHFCPMNNHLEEEEDAWIEQNI